MQGIDQYEMHNYANSLEEIVEAHAPLVLKIAKHLKRKLPSHIEFDDLVQSGFVGLIEASKSFKKDQGASFETFASIRVKGSMLDDLRKNSWNNREAIKNIKELGKAITTVEQRNQQHATSEDIATEMKISLSDYDKLCQHINICNITSMNHLNDLNLLPADENSPEVIITENNIKSRINDILEKLPERDQVLLSLYYIEELTFKEISEVLDLTEARICQLHAAVIAKISRKL